MINWGMLRDLGGKSNIKVIQKQIFGFIMFDQVSELTSMNIFIRYTYSHIQNLPNS